VAGLIDNHASFVVSIAQSSRHQLGYRPKQEVRYKEGKHAVFDVLRRFCTAHGITPRITEQSGSTYPRYKFVLSSRSDIIDFLAPLRSYLIRQDAAVRLLLDSLIPGLESGAHSERESFLAWVRVLEEFQQVSGRANRAKYDYEFFCDEWDVDPETGRSRQFNWYPETLRAQAQASPPESVADLPNGETQWLTPYVAALVDVHFNLVVSIGQQDTRAIGYKVMPKLQYNTDDQNVIHVLETFFSELGVHPQVREQDDTTYDQYQLVILQRDDIATVLETLRPYLIVRERAVDLLLDEIIPALMSEDHRERETFVELMGDIDAFRKAAGRANRATYDQEYFIDEWDLNQTN
jgi:hypothetical protein